MVGGRLCSQSDAAEDVRVQSDHFFEYLENTETLLDGYRRNADHRVRIAIVDSGVDIHHHLIRRLEAEAQGWPRLTTASFVNFAAAGEDHVGHGTHITATRFYVATVVDVDGRVNTRSVAKALTYSIEEWKVDIISLSLGFDRAVHRIDAALREADRHNILVFAAVSNYGAAAVRQIAWPASMTKVFGINSANFNGVTSSFNPPENDKDTFSRYKFLGEGVRSAWPLHMGEGEEKVLSGSSMAAPIAAATAALFLEFMRQNSHDEEVAADAQITQTADGMRAVFHLIGNAKSRGDFLKYVTPWHLLRSANNGSIKNERKHTLERIHEGLRDLRIYSSEEQDTATDISGEPPVFLAAHRFAPNAMIVPAHSQVKTDNQRRPRQGINRQWPEHSRHRTSWGLEARGRMDDPQVQNASETLPQATRFVPPYDYRFEPQQAAFSNYDSYPAWYTNPTNPFRPLVVRSPIFPQPLWNGPPVTSYFSLPHRQPYASSRTQEYSHSGHRPQQNTQDDNISNLRSSFQTRQSRNRGNATQRPRTSPAGLPPRSFGLENEEAGDGLEEIAGASSRPLTVENLRANQRELTKSNKWIWEDVSNSEEEETFYSDVDVDGELDLTINVTGQATIMVDGNTIECQDGGEITVRRERLPSF